jgi:hypothetical protein
MEFFGTQQLQEPCFSCPEVPLDKDTLSPVEILTGKKQDKDWTELLFEIVDQNDPSFFQ